MFVSPVGFCPNKTNNLKVPNFGNFTTELRGLHFEEPAGFVRFTEQNLALLKTEL